MDSPTLLYTKFLVPQKRRGTVPRPDLSETLRAGLKRRLTLISAPPGYGKTTLLVDFVARVKLPVLWYQMDAADSDLVVFMNYLTEGLHRTLWTTDPATYASFGNAARVLLHSTESYPAERILAVLMNELAQVPLDVLIVLEDYHLISNPALHQLMDRLIELAPPCVHVLISARNDPPLALARLRARQELVELRAADLRLSEAHITQLVRRVAPDLNATSTRLLSHRTEGWAAGIQLLLASLAGKTEQQAQQLINEVAGTHHSIFEYLAEEAFKQQADDVQSFLLRTAVLGQMNADSCNVILERSDSQQMLERLAQHNLFLVALDDKREWYRYHYLYREFLRAKFYREQAKTARLQDRAAGAYYESIHELDTAAAHFLQAEAYEDAARVLTALAPSYYDSGRVQILDQLLSALPASVAQTCPDLLVYHGATLRRLGQAGAANARLEQARATFAAVDDSAGSSFALVELAELALSQGDYHRAHQLAAEALSYTDPVQHDARARALMALARSAGFLQGTDRGRALAEEALQEFSVSQSAIAPTQRAQLLTTLGHICWWHGDPQSLVAYCREALRVLPAELSPIAAEAFMWLSTAYLYWNELTLAQEYAEKALQIVTKLELHQLLPAAYCSLGDVLTRRGEYAAGEELCRKAIELARELGMESYQQLMAAGSLAFNLCQQKRVEQARQVAETALWSFSESADTYEVCVCRSVLADVWLDAGRREAAEQLYESMLELEERRQFRIPLGMVYFGLAYIYLETGRHAAGVEMVRKSLALIAPTNTFQLYLDQGERARVVCRTAQQEGLEPDFVHRVLAGLAPSSPAVGVAQPNIEIRCLGPFRVFQSGVEITQERWVSAKARDLLAYFITFRHAPIPLDRIVEDVWYDAGPGRGKPAFHTALYRLRHALQTPERASKFIVAEAGDYRLAMEGFSVDVDDLERLLREAKSAQGASAIHYLEQAVALYNGEYLENLYYDWCLPQRARWREAALGALRTIVAHYSAPDPARAVMFAQRALAIDPLLEDMHFGLMNCYQRLGDRAAAIRQYRALETTLHENLDIAPGIEAQRLFRSLVE